MKKERIYHCTVLVSSIIFFGFIASRMFFPLTKNNYGLLKSIRAAGAYVSLLIAVWLLYRYLLVRLDEKVCRAITISLIAINAAAQIICLIYLRVSPSWDFGDIMKAAGDISAGRQIRNISYFREYPYNLNSAVLVGTFKDLLAGNRAAPYILNILAISISIAGSCLLSYRALGPRASSMTALFCLGATPLYLYAPIVYTDTLSMPFAIWSVYAVFSAGNRAGGLYKHGSSIGLWIFRFALVGITAGFGYLIKPLGAIGLAAFLIDYFFSRKDYPAPMPETKKAAVRAGLFAAPPAAALSAFLAVVVIFGFYVGSKGYSKGLDSSGRIPFTHWLMMGVNKPYAEGGTSCGYGGFSFEDLKLTRMYGTKQEKQQANLIVIAARLRSYGMRDYIAFLMKKAEWTWTDGTYYAPVKLARYPVSINWLHKLILPAESTSHKLYMGYSQSTQAVLLILIVAGCITALFVKTKAETENKAVFRLMTLMCLLLAAFLLFWETRSRYLVYMIPVFITMATYGAKNLFDKYSKIE